MRFLKNFFTGILVIFVLIIAIYFLLPNVFNTIMYYINMINFRWF